MVKIMKKIFRIAIIVMMLIIILENCIYAINTNITLGGTTMVEPIKDKISSILGILQVLGAVISVIALVVIGIRYMLSSVEEKADMKGVLIYYVVGAILVFATTSILSVVYNVITELTFD